MLCYLNGNYIDHATACVSVDDRGFLFADGVYEVIRVYDGKPFLLDEHLQRLRFGLGELRIRDDVVGELADIAGRLLDDNQLRTNEATIYIQVTRGAAPRTHAFPPAETRPTVYVIAKPFRNHPKQYFVDGVTAITVPDTRWGRCDIKTIGLTANVLANQAAKESGAFEAIFVRDGNLVEGSHTNLWAIIDGEAVTHERCEQILGGITRDFVAAVAREAGVPVREAPIPLAGLDRVQELFLSGTTTEIMPVVRLDDSHIGDGAAGPLTRKLQDAFLERLNRL